MRTSKKVLTLVGILVLALGSFASAATYDWNGAAADGDWYNPANWTCSNTTWTFPTQEDTAYNYYTNTDCGFINIANGDFVQTGIGGPTNCSLRNGGLAAPACVLTLDNGSTWQTAGVLWHPDGGSQITEVHVLNGSTLNANDIRMADNSGSISTTTVNNGTINVGIFRVGHRDNAQATLNITNGTINISGNLYQCDTGGAGMKSYVTMDGGIMTIGGNHYCVDDGAANAEGYFTLVSGTVEVAGTNVSVPWVVTGSKSHLTINDGTYRMTNAAGTLYLGYNSGGVIESRVFIDGAGILEIPNLAFNATDSKIIFTAGTLKVLSANLSEAGMQDLIDTGKIDVSAATGYAISTDGAYTKLYKAVDIMAEPLELNLDEEGATSATYQISLLYEPNVDGPGAGGGDTVIIICDPNGPGASGKAEDINIGNGPGGKIKLTFTSANWNVPQTVTVTAIDDSDIEGDHQVRIIQYLDPNALPADQNYATARIATVNVYIADNDVPVITITETDDWTFVQEGGVVDTYEIALSVQPTANALIEADPGNAEVALGAVPGGGTPGVALVLTFTPANWATPQTVHVTANDDAIVEPDEYTLIAHTATGTSQYATWPDAGGVVIDDVTAYVSDNDGPVLAMNDGIRLLLDYDDAQLGLDTSGSGANGRPFGDPTQVAGKVGSGALALDGDDYLDCSDPNVLEPTSAITVASWVNADSFSPYACVVGNIWDSGSTESGYNLGMWNNNRYVFALGGGTNATSVLAPTPVQFGQWDHLVGTYDGATVVLYINGVPVGAVAKTGPIDYDPHNIFGTNIGRFKDDNEDERVTGKIDQSAVWDRALTIAEVQVLYGAGSGYDLSALAAQPGIIVRESGGTTDVSEASSGDDDSYTVELTTTPSASVTVTVEPAAGLDIGNGDGVAKDLSFSAAATPQTVDVVTTVDDATLTVGELIKINHKATSSDADYQRLTPAYGDVQVEILQDECGAWGYATMDFDKNCYVDLKDYAAFAAKWLECTQPDDPECTDLN